jgi:hypothetical protein
MKYIVVILLTYMSLLTVSPALCGMYAALKQADLCCSTDSDKQCSKEQPDSNKQSDKSDSNTPCTPCCIIQNCHCYFVGVPQFDFHIIAYTTTQKIRVTNDNVFSNYSSECWHPPETSLIFSFLREQIFETQISFNI